MLTGERPSGLATRAFDVALDAARRPRAERVDLRRARRRGDAHRHPLSDRRRDRRAEGAAARRRERRRDAAAARSRQGRRRSRRPRNSCARSSRARRRFPASAIASTTPKIRAPRTCVRCRSDLGQRAGQPIWFEMSQRIEALVKAEKKLNPNVDFYSASTYYVLGIPIDLFTPIFAVSRVSGWTAHVLEQYANNRSDSSARRIHRPRYPQRYQPDLTPVSDSGGPCPHPKFLGHRAHRPRQVDACRSLSRDDGRAAGARDGSAGPRRDGSRARARHHDQGASGPPELHGERRADSTSSISSTRRGTSTSPTK